MNEPNPAEPDPLSPGAGEVPVASEPVQRSFREARWWQARIGDDDLHQHSFHRPTLNQTLVILESLDRREPGWDKEPKLRHECRFMNELATLSPELCKPGCGYPHKLPDADAVEEESSGPVPPAFSRPSLPVGLRAQNVACNDYAASTPSYAAATPAWSPPVQPPVQVRFEKPGSRESRLAGWGLPALLLILIAMAAGVYVVLIHGPDAALERGGAPSAPSAPSAPGAHGLPGATVAALESRKRAIAKHPDLARPNSPLNQRFLAAYRRLDAEHSPRLQQPDWPERLADECAAAH